MPGFLLESELSHIRVAKRIHGAQSKARKRVNALPGIQVVVDGGKDWKLVVIPPLFAAIRQISYRISIERSCIIKYIPSQFKTDADIGPHHLAIVDGNSPKARTANKIV